MKSSNFVLFTTQPTGREEYWTGAFGTGKVPERSAFLEEAVQFASSADAVKVAGANKVLQDFKVGRRPESIKLPPYAGRARGLAA